MGLEAFYGGAAGGGKSDGILMSASQFFSWPNYSALILRRTLTEGAQASSIMDRAIEWWADRFHYNDSKKLFVFPSGATLRFGYLKAERDKFRYQSSEYQFIGFDELTHFSESQYLYLFSRCRGTIENPVPLRVRSGSNPGGLGHFWVKNRFITDEAEQDILAGTYANTYEKQTDEGELVQFVPARKEDNPSITPEYEAALARLPRVERAQLSRGDWTIAADGVFDIHDLRYYRLSEDSMEPFYTCLDERGSVTERVFVDSCYRFVRIDPAGTVQERGKEHMGKPGSWSVIGVFDLNIPKRLLFVRHITRLRCEAPELLANVADIVQKYRPAAVGCENTGLGLPIYQLLHSQLRCNVEPLDPEGKDKYTRSVMLQKWIEDHRVLFPSQSTNPCKWLQPLLGEMLSWQALPDQTADQIDVMSYAAIEAEHHGDSLNGSFVLPSTFIRSPLA